MINRIYVNQNKLFVLVRIFHFYLGPLDLFTLSNGNPLFYKLLNSHKQLCGCNNFRECIKPYRRCVVSKIMYHSLQYTKRKSTISYFVRYLFRPNMFEFGMIEVFFRYQGQTYALVKNFQVVNAFSDYLTDSHYYELLKQPINKFFFVLKKTNNNSIVSVEKLEKHMILFEDIPQKGLILATPVSSMNEHD